MKRVFIIFCCILSSVLVFSQYFHFPDSNAIWSVYTEKYFIQGDSIFNSINYKKYYQTFDSIVTSGSFFALVREDTISKRVFAIPAENNDELLIYDFSLALNDTCTVYPLSFDAHSGPILIRVEQIDSILLNGQYHKRFKMTDFYNDENLLEYWIDGIGSTLGVFNSGLSGLGYADITYPTLLCLEHDGILIFDNPDFIDCYEPYPIGIDENISFNNIEVFPNPTNNIITIKSDDYIKECNIASSHGNYINRKDVSGKVYQMDISNFPPGIYLLYIETSKENAIKKILKIGL